MIKKIELNLKELGDLAKIIPGPEPRLKVSATLGRIIPVCEPKLNGNESRYVARCLETNWISSTGNNIEQFEKNSPDAVEPDMESPVPTELPLYI